MAIPRVDISQEIADWQAAVYGEEVRSANVSALTKLQTQMNAACDGIETAQTDVATAVNTANAASATANQASSDAQDAIDDAQAAITTAQGYAANAEGSAQAAAASATAAQTAQTNAQTAQLAAEAAEQAAEDAARQAQIAINITPDEETIHHASDAVGTISAITYTLEEIAAMTDPSGKIPDASAVESLRESLTTSTASRIYYKGWSSGTASWQTETADIDVSQYKKILLIVMNIGATESSGIYNVEDLKVMSNLALKQSAYYDASTMAIGMIQIIDVANTTLRVTNTCKSNTLPCNVTVYGLK